MRLVIPKPPLATVAVAGGGAFPVHRIYCVGRNYAAHAREMGSDPGREPPFFFTKPADAVVADSSPIPFPLATEELHHEIELVVALSMGGVEIAEDRALDLVYGYAVGLDMTRRDLQQQAKDTARPWDAGKAFDRSAPIGEIRRAAEIGHPESGRIWLEVNGELRQESDLSHLIWNVPETIRHLSSLFELAPGDLIMTGTPEGVAAVAPGDRLVGGIDGVGSLRIRYGT
jgi:fumarylpyruvate hydrolase